MTWPLPSGRPIIITLRLKKVRARRRRGVGCCDRGSACPAVASPPGWARRYSSRTPVQHARATRRAACQAARTRGARARRLFGGVWRLGAAGGRGWQRARLCSRRWSLVPGSVRSRGTPVVWRLQCSGRALSSHFRARQGRALDGPLHRRRKDELHVWSEAASGASSKCRGKRSGLSARSSGTRSDPPSRTLSVERGSNHF